MVSPLISSESQDDPPQTSHLPDTDSVLLDLDGLVPALKFPNLEPGEDFRTVFFVADSLDPIISTCSCIVAIEIFKL